jgi:D-alanine--poly(phosphoribitol) ligase subunit 2
MPNAKLETIKTEIAILLSDVFNIDVLTSKTDLFESGILDSSRFVELLLHIEKKFQTKITVDDFEMDNFRCIEKIANLVLRHKNAPN